MNKILQILVVIGIAISSVKSSAAADTPLQNVADMGNELMYELVELNSKESVTG